MSKHKSTESMNTAVATRGETALATAEDIAALGEFQPIEVSKDDVAIPFLIVLQPLSPQVTPGNAAYIESARPGKIFHTISKELFDHIHVVVADYKRSFIEWVPRDKGGGFRGEYQGAEIEATFNKRLNRETGRALLENGNQLTDTRSFFVLTSQQDDADSAPTIAPAMIAMASTQIRVAKEWNNRILNYVPPGQRPGTYAPWACVYRLGTVLNKNEKGSWFGWTIERAGFNRSPELREAASLFQKQIRQGMVKVDRSALEPEHEGAAPDDGKTF